MNVKILKQLSVYARENTPASVTYTATTDDAGRVITAAGVARLAAEEARTAELVEEAALVIAAEDLATDRAAEIAARAAVAANTDAANEAALAAALVAAESAARIAVRTETAALQAAAAAARLAYERLREARLAGIAAANELAEAAAALEQETEEEPEPAPDPTPDTPDPEPAPIVPDTTRRDAAILSASRRIRAGLQERRNARNARIRADESRGRLSILYRRRGTYPALIKTAAELLVQAQTEHLRLSFSTENPVTRDKKFKVLKSRISYLDRGLTQLRSDLADARRLIPGLITASQRLVSTAERLEGVADAAERALIAAAQAVPTE